MFYLFAGTSYSLCGGGVCGRLIEANSSIQHQFNPQRPLSKHNATQAAKQISERHEQNTWRVQLAAWQEHCQTSQAIVFLWTGSMWCVDHIPKYIPADRKHKYVRPSAHRATVITNHHKTKQAHQATLFVSTHITTKQHPHSL